MGIGEHKLLTPDAGFPVTIGASDVDLSLPFAGPPWSQPYARQITNTSATGTIALQLVRVNDAYVTPPTVGGSIEYLLPGRSRGGLFTKIIAAGSPLGATVLVEP